MFNASIINLKSGAQDVGTSVNYKTINDGMEVMQTLARKLSYGNETEWRVSTAESFMRAVEIINNSDASNYTIILTGSFTLSKEVRFSENGSKTVTITGDSQRRTINNCNIRFEKGIHLVLGNNVTLDGNGKGTVVYVSYSRLTLQEGAVLQNGNTGVFVIEGSFTMNGGTISGNTNTNRCGGVEVVNSTTFTMNGGTISGNTGRGGGVYTGTDSTFTMNGGTISGNTAQTIGGGVYHGSKNTFRMTGGTISGNTANERGGGVSNGGNFRMTGGTISGNTARGEGGGVWSGNFTCPFIKTGGTIDETNSAKDGKVAYSVEGGKRNRAVGPNDNLDSSKKGRAGGWE
jgi:hypothetical protein